MVRFNSCFFSLILLRYAIAQKKAKSKICLCLRVGVNDYVRKCEALAMFERIEDEQMKEK